MRYVQQDAQPKKESKKKEKKEEKPIKAGMSGYDYYELSSAKKIPTKDGWK